MTIPPSFPVSSNQSPFPTEDEHEWCAAEGNKKVIRCKEHSRGTPVAWKGATATGEFMKRLLIAGFLLISTAPSHTQVQQPDPAKLKADAQKVVGMISRDKLKARTYCQMIDLSDQLDQEENPAKTDELSRKIDNLRGKLGPEFTTLIHDLSNMDPDSQDAQDIHVMIESLDSLCGD